MLAAQPVVTVVPQVLIVVLATAFRGTVQRHPETLPLSMVRVVQHITTPSARAVTAVRPRDTAGTQQLTAVLAIAIREAVHQILADPARMVHVALTFPEIKRALGRSSALAARVRGIVAIPRHIVGRVIATRVPALRLRRETTHCR